MKRKRKQVAIPESNFPFSLSRRSSSLVTVSLDDDDDETSNEGIDRPDSITPVIQIGNDDEMNADNDRCTSSERIFEVVVDVRQQGSSTTEDRVSSGCCRKTSSWLRSCKNERINFGCGHQISDFFKRKLEQLNEKLQKECGSSYLETFFFYANVCGVSPFRFDKNQQRVVWLKKAPYYVVNALAAVDTALLAKDVILDMTGAHLKRSANIQQHLSISLTAANVLLRAGFFASLQMNPEKYSTMMKTISSSSYRKHLYTVKVFIVSLLICCSSISLILIRTNIGLLNGFEKHLIENAEDMRWLFCPQTWCTQNEPKGLNFSTVTLGLLGWATKFAGNILLQVARDGILFAALALGKSANAFRFKHRVTNSTSVDDTITIGTEILNDYEWIKKISKHINSAFNTVFRFFLLSNIFMFAVFLDEWFDPQFGKAVKFMKLVNILIVCITFYYANQTAKTEDRFKEWMKKEQNRTILGLTEINVQTEMLSPSSIGLGRGAFFIHDSTLIGIASVVTAYYLGIVETRPQNEMKTGTGNFCALCANLNCSNVH